MDDDSNSLIKSSSKPSSILQNQQLDSQSTAVERRTSSAGRIYTENPSKSIGISSFIKNLFRSSKTEEQNAASEAPRSTASHSTTSAPTQKLSTMRKIKNCFSGIFGSKTTLEARPSMAANPTKTSITSNPRTTEVRVLKARAALTQAQKKFNAVSREIPPVSEKALNKARDAVENARLNVIATETPLVKAALSPTVNIEGLLNTLHGREAITNFLTKQVNKETLDCLDELKSLKEMIDNGANEIAIKQKYEDFISTYISVGSQSQVNISDILRNKIIDSNKETTTSEERNKAIEPLKTELTGIILKEFCSYQGRSSPASELKKVYDIPSP